MAGTARQIAYRLKAEGRAEVVRDAQAVGQALKDSYDKGVQGADAATAAADRLERKYKAQAAAATSAAAAQASQGRFNAILGVDPGVSNSARDSAAFFQELADGEERAARMARELKAQLDPVGAAQDRLNDELRLYDDLVKRGQITTKDLAQAQTMARQRFDETAAAAARQERGLTRLAAASRLNLARQVPDVAVTLAGGMNPLMVALQQGPQIADAWSTSNINLSKSMLLVGGAAGALAIAAGAATAAYLEGERSATAYERAVSGIGRVQGLTADQLRELTSAAAEQGEISKRSAQEQAAAYLATGKIGGEMIGNLISISKDYASFVGTDMKGAEQQLIAAMLEPSKAAEAFTDSTGLLTREQRKNIDTLMEQGNLLGAQKIIFDELQGAVSGHASQVGEMTSLWDDLGRKISNATHELGEFFYQTQDERIKYLEMMVGASKTPMARQRFQSELWVEQQQKGIAAMLAAGKADEAAKNQQDLRDDQIRERREREAEAAGRKAEAAVRRRQAEADRAQRERQQRAREALQRSRREEDVTSGRDLEIARILNQTGLVRELERENAIRQRTRQLIDDGADATKAATQAEDEQRQIDDARAQAAEKQVATIRRSVDLEVARISGRTEEVTQAERAAEIEERRKAYIEAGINTLHQQVAAMDGVTDAQRDQIANLGEIVVTEQSLAAAKADQLRIDEARAAAAERTRSIAAREWQITLARARGDRTALRGLDRDTWIDNRAREIEGINKTGLGSGDEQAARDYADLMHAETTGAFRDSVSDLIKDIRSGGIREALSNQFESAADRLIDRLISRMMDNRIDEMLNDLLKADFSGGTDRGFGAAMNKGLDFLFGKNADGTEYWRGGPTWVGERGPELLNLPRGAQVIEHQRSLRMVAGATSAPAINNNIRVINQTSEPVSARMIPTRDGLDVILAPAVRGEVQKMGADGSLAKASRLTPRGVTR